MRKKTFFHFVNSQRGRLESTVRRLTAERTSVGEAMVWCLEHADAAMEVSECLAEAICNEGTTLPKRVGCRTLVSAVN